MFSGILDFVGSLRHPCHVQGDCCTIGEGCNRACPSSRDGVGVLQPLLHCAQERRWPSANSGSASLESGPSQASVQDVDTEAHHQMHPAPGLVCSGRPEGWWFHVSILPQRRPFLRFVFEGRAWLYRVLPFGLSLSPRVFTKVAEGALARLLEVGIRILYYLEHGSLVRKVVGS